ncbi:hypothetical protein [Pseudomonas sp. RC10]|uniref:hypothetical protein n=1 Tax=Pseudomonas bambusae TaxID=3139142 RepID=UPI003138A27A
MTLAESRLYCRLLISLKQEAAPVSKPYAFVNERPQSYHYLRDHLLAIPLGARPKFDQLNPYLNNIVVMPGEVVIVGDGPAHLCTPEETQLMQLAQDVRMSMIGTSGTERGVMVQNFDMLQSIMSYGSIGIGASTGAWNKHLRGVESTLKEIEALHQRWRSGALSNDPFFAQRRTLFARMETHLKGIGRFGTGLNNQGKMKRILGILSKSYLHTGEIADYAKNVRGVSKMAGAMSKGAYVGIALDVGAGALEIKEACSAGREEECSRAKYVEGGKAAVGIGLATVGATAGLYLAGAFCIAIGIPTGGMGTLACAVIGGSVGAYAGGQAGSYFGEQAGEKLFEHIER